MKFSTMSLSEIVCCLVLLGFSNKVVSTHQGVHLAQRYELRHAARSNQLSIAGIVKGDRDRLAFIAARFHGGTPAEGAAGVGVQQAKYMQGRSARASSDRIPVLSGLVLGAVYFIIRVGLGTPPQYLYLALDTGSDLAWAQCVPCSPCFKQHDPIFVPAQSSSYQQISCGSAECALVRPRNSRGKCLSSKNASALCDFFIGYLESSTIAGDVALEALTLLGDARPVATAYPFGCGRQNKGNFAGVDGVIGFSRDPLAFPAQTKAVFGERFAYCLPDLLSEGVGYIEFGKGAGRRLPGENRSTPLVKRDPAQFYLVELESIEVEGKEGVVSIKLGAISGTSNGTVVDSGTLITRLNTPLYEQVLRAFKEASASLKLKDAGTKPLGLGLNFEACYTGITAATKVPSITFTFAGGLTLSPSALFPYDFNGTFCLDLLPLPSDALILKGVSILGGYHQQGRLFTFDNAHSSLSISSKPC